MRNIYLIVFVLFIVSNQLHSQENRYKGIPNDIVIMNPYWTNYKDVIRAKHIESIKISITRGIDNYTLMEYCFALNELLAYLENNTVIQNQWRLYMDSLVIYSKGNALRSGIVPLESQFFIATLKRNEKELVKSFPNAFSFLISNTPKMTVNGYMSEDYESILLEKGFSEIKGEEIIFDLLSLEDVYLLDIIRNNTELSKRFNMWLTYKVPDRSFAFEFSEDRASEILRRKFLYLWNIFKQQGDELSQYTAKQLLKIKVVHPKSVPQDSPLRIINGTWQGSFGDKKEIYFLNSFSNVNNSANKVTGKSKFVGQPDSKYLSMVGYYKDIGEKFALEMKEQPDTVQWNGVFKYEIDKETRIIKGTWESNNGKLKREFELEKISEDDW